MISKEHCPNANTLGNVCYAHLHRAGYWICVFKEMRLPLQWLHWIFVFWDLPAVGWDTHFKTSEPQRQLRSGSEQIQPDDAERQSKATGWRFQDLIVHPLYDFLIFFWILFRMPVLSIPLFGSHPIWDSHGSHGVHHAIWDSDPGWSHQAHSILASADDGCWPRLLLGPPLPSCLSPGLGGP